MINNNLKKFLIFFSFSVYFFPFISFAQNESFRESLDYFSNLPKKCSYDGYSIFTINGMFTEEEDARFNKRMLEDKLPKYFNSEPVSVDYLYNPSHIGGLGEVFTVAYQKFFDTEIVEDHDFKIMLKDASQKFINQKILLVGHSQGNFYANSLYDYLVGKTVQLKPKSLSVYGVATPASRVAGGGGYITSKNDEVINFVRTKKILNVLPANLDVTKTFDNTNGHSFNDIYLKYAGNRVVEEIKNSLSKLTSDYSKNEGLPCIQKVELGVADTVVSEVLKVVDPLAKKTKDVAKPVVSNVVNFVKYTYTGFASIYPNKNEITANVVEVIKDVERDEIQLNKQEDSGTIENNQKEESLVKKENGFGENLNVLSGDKLAVISSEDENKVVSLKEINTQNFLVVEKSTSSNERKSGGGGTVSKNMSDQDNNFENNNGSSQGDDNKENIDDQESGEDVEENENESGGTEDEDSNEQEEEEETEEVDENVEEETEGSEEGEQETGEENNQDNENENSVDTTPPVISFVGDVVQFVKKGEVYVDPGVSAYDDVDGEVLVSVQEISSVTLTPPFAYNITYRAVDSSGNFSTKVRTVTTADNIYVDKYSFGVDELGRNWQVWSFNGSNIFDWVNSYVNNYLKQEFTIQTFRGLYCGQCLQIGIFKRGDPKKGFDYSDVLMPGLEYNPQNNMDDKLYRISIQWDLNGYDYVMTNQDGLYRSGRVNIDNLNENTWIGWNGSYNSFRSFPSGDWQGIPYGSLFGRTGGSGMVLTPYPIINHLGLESVFETDGAEENDNSLEDVEENDNEEDGDESENENEETEDDDSNEQGEVEETEDDNSNEQGEEEETENDDSNEEESNGEESNEGESINGEDEEIENDNEEEEEESTEDDTEEEEDPELTEEELLNLPIKLDYNFTYQYIPNQKGNIIFNPNLGILSINILASKNIIWVDTFIESVNNSNVFRKFGGSFLCSDNTNICLRAWNGALSSGGSGIVPGDYRIKVIVKDLATGYLEEIYLPPVITLTLD